MRLFGAIAISFLCLAGADASNKAPAQMQPSPQAEYRGASDDRTAEQQKRPSDQPPSVIDLFKPNGINRIAAYCVNHSDDRPDDWLHNKFICEIHVTDVAVVWFSLALVVVTVGLIVVGLMQATIMRLTARRQLRAYVFVESVEISEIQIGSTPQIAVTIKNFGQTPAFNLTQWASAGLDTYPQPTRAPGSWPHAEFPERALGPSDTFIVRPTALPNPINEAAVRALHAREAAIYIAGGVRYRDAFNKRRHTKYRLFLNAESGMREFAGHQMGNEAS